MKIKSRQYARLIYELEQDLANQPKEETEKAMKYLARIIIRNRDQKKLPEIINYFYLYRRKKEGIIKGVVFSKEKLEEDVLKRIREILARRQATVAKKVLLKNEEKKEIKGGLLIYAEDEIIDASLAGKINQLAAMLLK